MEDVLNDIYSGLSIGAVPGNFTHLKWSLVPPDFKECLYKIFFKIVQILIKKSIACN
jgi:hypothetical protein